MTDPTTPATVARADERRRLAAACIEDEHLVDHIVEILIDERTALYDDLSGKYSLDAADLHRLVTLSVQETLVRASVDIMTKAWVKDSRRDVHAGMYEAAQTVKEMRL